MSAFHYNYEICGEQACYTMISSSLTILLTDKIPQIKNMVR